jgi:hypothetical protein
VAVIAVVAVIVYVGVVLFAINRNENQRPGATLELEFNAGFETGDFSELGPSPFTNSGSGAAEVVSEPTHSGRYALAMKVTDATPGVGVRTRVDGDIFEDQGYFGGENLPDEAYFSAWFYIPQYVDLDGGDPWNIFQFKQTYPNGTGYTRRMIDSIKLWDRGSDYGFTVKSNVDAQGNWDNTDFREWQNDTVRVGPGEWFQLKVLRRFGGVGDGHYTVWVNDTEIFDLDIPTEMYGGPWDNWGQWRRQWTLNNYVTGEHEPNSHSLYLDDLAVRSVDQVTLNEVGLEEALPPEPALPGVTEHD